MKKNDCFELSVTDLTDLGFGVAHVDGFTVFIGGAVTGDRVRAKIIKVNHTFAVARTEEILLPSPHRTEGRCPIGGCNCCAFRDVGYGFETQSKHDQVVAAFRKVGLSDVPILPTVVSPSVTHYRNKAIFPVALDKNGNYVIGFFAPKTHTVKEAAACPLAPDVFPRILEELRSFFKEKRISVYDESTRKGLIRHVYLRRGEVTGEILLTLILNGSSLPDEEILVKRITGDFPEIVGVLINENREDTNVVLGEKFRTLWGKDFLIDVLAGVPLRLTAPSFYQVNHGAAEILYAKAKELACLTGNETLLDLFCGVGSIGLSMADAAKEIIGIEIVPSAVLCARENAKAAGISNAAFFTGDATDTEKLLVHAETEVGHQISPDVIVLDPPRKGCDEKLIRFTVSLSPKRIVYVSCNPDTLARDTALYRSLGYEPGEVTPVDLFPGTGHVESVVCLTQM